jgi:hypothetical protein
MTKKTHRSANGSGHIRKRSDGTWEGQYTAAFTLDTYACVTGEMQRDAAAKIDAYYKALRN